MSISSGVNGVLPVMGRMTVDTSHNPGYAAGYLFNQLQPRLAMTTHMSYDSYSNPELFAQIREHYKGPFHSPLKFDISAMGGMLVPPAKYDRADIQQQSIRDAEIPPEDYYPEGYAPERITVWPTDKPIFIPKEMIPGADQE